MKARPTETEAGFLKTVLQFAKLHGWRSAHFRPAWTADGWRTAVSGDGMGFPDLVLVRRGVFLVAELKTDRGRTTAEQDAWLAAFQAAGVAAYTWRPSDWPAIAATLGATLR